MKKPYKLYWIMMWLCLFFGWLSQGQRMDIQMHDTYLVVDPFAIGIIYALFFGFWGLLYWLRRDKKASNLSNWFHFVVNIVVLLGLWGAMLSMGYISLSVNNGMLWVWGVLLFGLIQVVFVVNVLVGLMRE